MKVEIASTLLAELLESAARSPGREICGLLFGSPAQISGYQPATNVAADPARTFEIDPVQLLAAHRHARTAGPAVIGHYHSHPSGQAEPSATDAARADEPGALWLILTTNAAYGLFRADPNGPIHGRFTPCVVQTL